MKQSTAKYLRNGFDAAKSEDELSEAGATAGLYLAQLLLSDGKYDEAIELLEDKKAGPLALVSRKHAAAVRPQFKIEAYKAALWAYVSTIPPQEKKALKIMQSLEEAVRSAAGNASEATAQLTRIYVGRGVALQKQIEELRTAGRTDEANRANAAFTQFLNRIGEQQGTASWQTRVWLAQMYYNMAGEPGEGAANATARPLTAEARGYIVKARDAYQALLNETAKDPKLAPNDTAVLAVRMQLGECFRVLGQYEQALDSFSTILKDREASLPVQRAAALTYQARGEHEDKKWLENAIQGGNELPSTKENLIWGWLKISKVVARMVAANQKYRDAFFEARVNIARCRYMAAMKSEGDARKQDLAKAKQGIQALAQLYPELGGEKWRAKFDAVMKQIQTASGEKPNGLGEFVAEKKGT